MKYTLSERDAAGIDFPQTQHFLSLTEDVLRFVFDIPTCLQEPSLLFTR